jgi:hypothetical protein
MPKEIRDPSLPAEHIGQLPPGYKRDEEKAKRTDELAAKIDAEDADPEGLKAIDPAKFRRIDNEIAQRVGRDGMIHISGADHQKFRYGFVKHAATCDDSSAKGQVRLAHEKLRAVGWFYVKENDPEARELMGNDCAAGTTLRGWGDTVLMAIHRDYAEAQDRKMDEKTRRNGAVEERTQALGISKGVIFEGAAGNFDPRTRLGRAFPGEMGTTEHYIVKSQFTEGDVRRGSIPGMPAPQGRR